MINLKTQIGFSQNWSQFVGFSKKISAKTSDSYRTCLKAQKCTSNFKSFLKAHHGNWQDQTPVLRSRMGEL